MRTPIRSLLALAIATAALSLPTAASHEGTNHGTIKVHDDATADPARRNEPHVSCDFWIEGFKMADDAGTLTFYRVPPTSSGKVEVSTSNWTADSGDLASGWHFLAGPFNFTSSPGHYRVEAFLAQGHPGNEGHFAKSKTFWVNPCGAPSEDVPCPPGVEAVAGGDGSVELSWSSVAGATQYRIYRAVGGGELDDLAYVDGATTSFTDSDTTVGETYTYVVTAVVGGFESEACEEVSVTAIPLFPSLAVALAAGAACLAGFVALRRHG